MARWEPNARGRLEQAALELFHDRGYARTTVEEIATRAGLTERTFFRYFADKREVLFWGSDTLRQLIVNAIAGAPRATAPLDAVTAALASTAAVFQHRRDRARIRRALIAGHAELQERELIKLESLGAAIADSLRERGVADPAASLTAALGIAMFKIAFESWVNDARSRDLAHHIRTAVVELKLVAAGAGAPASRTTARARRAPARAASKRRAVRRRARDIVHGEP